MFNGVSVATVAVSAGVGILTSYVGTLINYGRQRNRHRRVFGLSLLAEVKSLQRIFRRHYHLLEAGDADPARCRVPTHFGSADFTVFSNGSGNLGVFSTRTAVEVIEFYSAVRELAAQAQMLAEMQRDPAHEAAVLRAGLADHLASLRLGRHRSRDLVAALRREVPLSPREATLIAVRRLSLFARRLRRRLRRPSADTAAAPQTV